MTIEFYHVPDGTFKEPINIKVDSKWNTLEELDNNTVEIIIRKLLNNQSAAISLKTIMQWKHVTEHREMLKHFIICNWGKLDNVMDIDESDQYHFEKVSCAIRSTCPYNGIVCIK